MSKQELVTTWEHRDLMRGAAELIDDLEQYFYDEHDTFLNNEGTYLGDINKTLENLVEEYKKQDFQAKLDRLLKHHKLEKVDGFRCYHFVIYEKSMVIYIIVDNDTNKNFIFAADYLNVRVEEIKYLGCKPNLEEIVRERKAFEQKEGYRTY